jgi:flagellar hook-associated protein 1 FlgK
VSGLFDSLRSVSRTLDAHRLGIDVAGQNLANVNTVGYTRRTLVLAEVPSSDFYNAGRGVEVLGVRAHRDQLLDDRIRREQQGAAYDAAVVSSLTAIEAAVGAPGQGLDARLTAFFDSFATFADDVRSVAARDNVLTQARSLATGFRQMAGALETARRDADIVLRGAVHEVNALAAEIGRLNGEIVQSAGDTQALRDQRNVVLAELAKIAPIAVVFRTDGGAMDVTIGGGRPLVMGNIVYDLEVANDPSGYARLTVQGADVTAELTSGRIGALLQTRDSAIPAHATRLDQLAFDVATAVNAAHTAGFDLNGNAGVALFTIPGTATGAAAAIAVNAAVAADASLLAGSATGAAGDNGAARTIAGLRDVRIAAGGTATAADSWGMFVYHVGASVANAAASGASRDEVVRQLQRLRDEASGVSIDEEAANLMRFQRAYEANARYFTAVSDTIDTLMEMVL